MELYDDLDVCLDVCHGVLFSVQLCTTYATNFIIKTQVEALYTHMRVSQKFFQLPYRHVLLVYSVLQLLLRSVFKQTHLLNHDREKFEVSIIRS